MSDAFLSSAIMLLALGLFVSDRIRPDAVELGALAGAWLASSLFPKATDDTRLSARKPPLIRGRKVAR